MFNASKQNKSYSCFVMFSNWAKYCKRMKATCLLKVISINSMLPNFTIKLLAKIHQSKFSEKISFPGGRIPYRLRLQDRLAADSQRMPEQRIRNNKKLLLARHESSNGEGGWESSRNWIFFSWGSARSGRSPTEFLN